MDERGFVSREVGRARLEQFIASRRDAGDKAAAGHFAKEMGVSGPFLSILLSGQKPLPEKIARAIGLRPVKGYLELTADEREGE